MNDPELQRLLVEELRRHLELLERATTSQDTLRSIHALKGSTGLAGETELAASFARLERRLRDGDGDAALETIALVRDAWTRMVKGERPTTERWPMPPKSLRPMNIDPALKSPYLEELTDRLARIDDALAKIADPLEATLDIYRHVHTMKGAASAVGDEPMTWFAHGLEEMLRGCLESRERARAVLLDFSEWRGVLGGLLDDPVRALLSLRARAEKRPSTAMLSARPFTSEEDGTKGAPEDAGTIRVAAALVDRLLDGVVSINLVREQVAARSERNREASRALRQLRTDLLDALRQIGPPRPWGAPAAALTRIEKVSRVLEKLESTLDEGSTRLRESDVTLRETAMQAQRVLSAMRQTPARKLFQRVQQAVEAEARRFGRQVAVRTRGGEELIDARLAEALAEPCLHLARNTVAHGIESDDARRALGKPGHATVTLSARLLGGRLILTIADDGAGVDVAAVRRRAVESGVVSSELAHAADDETLLTLLFVPGFSTKDGADLLAGRGIGLDLVLATVQRLGGVIRLWSERGRGFSAKIDVPTETGLGDVLWIRAGDEELAVGRPHAKRVRTREANEAVVPLGLCLGHKSAGSSLVIELEYGEEDESPLLLGIDGVGRIEEVLVRPVSPVIRDMGPYAGAIVRGDGSLRLALDVHALAPRVRAMTARAR